MLKFPLGVIMTARKSHAWRLILLGVEGIGGFSLGGGGPQRVFRWIVSGLKLLNPCELRTTQPCLWPIQVDFDGEQTTG